MARLSSVRFSKQWCGWVLLTFWLFCHQGWTPAFAADLEVVTLTEDTDFRYLADKTEYIDDPTRRLTIRDVVRGPASERFQAHNKKIANFGMTSHAYWFRVPIRNMNPEVDSWILGFEYSLLDYIDIYFPTGKGQIVHKQSGDRRPFEMREIKSRYFYFRIPLSYQQKTTLYIRVQTAGSAEIPLVIMTPNHYAKQDHELQFGQGIFTGIMVIMLLYNLMIAFGSKDLDYFLYAFFIGSLLIFKATMNGITNEYLWPGWIWWANAASAFSTPLVFFAACLYGWKFLSAWQYPRMNKIFWLAFFVLGGSSIASFILPYRLIKLYTVFGLLSNILLVGSSTYCYMQGFKPARFFILSFIALITGSIVYGFQKLGYIPVSFWTVNCVEITSALQALLLSLSQADKLNVINKKIRRAQKKALNAQIETNRVTEMMKNKLEHLVQERTAALWDKTRNIRVMMDNLKQGLCTVDENLHISGEYSAYLETILGQKNLDQKSLNALVVDRLDLAPDEKSQLTTSIQAMIGEDSLNFEANAHVLPRKAIAQLESGERHLELDWAPIEDQDDSVSRVMVALRDVTEIYQFKAEAENRQHELEIIGQILKLSAVKFQNFINNAFHLIDNCRTLLEDPVDEESWHAILRYIHTIKGNARTYGFDDITHKVHAAEDFLFAVDRTNISQEEIERTLRELAEIEETVMYYQELNDNKLGRTGAGETERAVQDVAGFLKMLAKDGVLSRYLHDTEVIRMVNQVHEATNDSFRSAIRPVLDSIPSLAEQLGKRPPKIVFLGDDFEIQRKVAEIYEDIFVHLVRNSLDHGFLPHTSGEIYLEVLDDDAGRWISYWDSGRGLNLRKLRTKGIEKGLLPENAPDTEVIKLVFHSGVSSADKVTDISGRGVGMDAVKAFVQQLGGTIDIQLSEESAEAGFRKFKFLIKLPPVETIKLDHAS
jgi:two-component sensor histidine kinase/HPt (histidine-containing phosphotransfer) domain-containing protein